MSDKMREAFENCSLHDGYADDKRLEENRTWFTAGWQAAHGAALPPGFVAVPVEATDEMIDVACEAADAFRLDMVRAYAAMLAARPEVK